MPKTQPAIQLPDHVWHDPATLALCRAHDANALLKLCRRHGITNEALSYWTHISTGEISRRIRGHETGNITAIHRWTRIANALNMPDANRVEAGLAPQNHPDAHPIDHHAAAEPSTAATDGTAMLGVRVATLFAAVDAWPSHTDNPAGLQGLLHQEILMFDTANAGGANSAVFSSSRRQALITLAAIPLAFAIAPAAPDPVEEAEHSRFLTRCSASLTACWHLLKGSEMHAVENVLSPYLLRLGGMARQASRYQRTAALLASQAHRICGILALHRSTLAASGQHFQQACHYARLSSDPCARAAALSSLGSNHFYHGDPAGAADIFENALAIESISALQRSRLHAELAAVYAQMGREEDAVKAIALAEKFYPDQPEQDATSLYAEFTPASFALERGLALLALGEQNPERGYAMRALEAFNDTQRGDSTPAPDRIVYEITNHQAAAAVVINDLDVFETHLSHGIDGATLLRSRQRLSETRSVWQRAAQRWPREPRMELLGERLHAAQARALDPATP